MNIALWIVTGLLAAVASASGTVKMFTPKAKLAQAPGGRWTATAGAGVIKTLGGVEVLAAIGLILPAVLGIAPVLVPVTAVCWALLMVGAMIAHARYGEYKVIAANVVYLAMAVFVAGGRFWLEPFTA
ncbi:DoxX family protein [Nocardia brasiliensis]|uniref:DoxX family protein n=1 Tax=Nocardia brasiliensis TaxID=37326 RepID=UPI0018950DC4|nr:DoxX family protein [Nocardia brasiliensis]MBF6547287.1 DoxX family protein [Nocardia brasiliensis]